MSSSNGIPFQGSSLSGNIEGKAYEGQRAFPEDLQPKRNDVIGTILYTIYSCITLGFVVFSAVCFGYKWNYIDPIGLGIATILSPLFVIFTIYLFKRWAKPLVYFSYAILFLYSIFTFIYFFRKSNKEGTIISGIFTVLMAIMFWMVFSRINFTCLVIKESLTSLTKTYSVYFLALATTAIKIVYFYSIFIFLLLNEFEESTLLTVSRIIVLVHFIWTCYALSAITSLIVSGTLGTHFYFGRENAYGQVQMTERDAFAKSTKRALTSSLGTALLGSLVLCISQIIKILFRCAINSSDGRGAQIFLICLSQLYSFMDYIIKYVSEVSYVRAGIYGESYVKAIKNTCKMFTRVNGLDIIIGDSIVGTLSFAVSFALALVLANTISFIAVFLNKFISFNGSDNNGNYMFFTALAISYAAILSAIDIVKAGVTSMLVCIAEEPHVLLSNRPQLAFELFNAHPKVQYAVEELHNYDPAKKSQNYYTENPEYNISGNPNYNPGYAPVNP